MSEEPPHAPPSRGPGGEGFAAGILGSMLLFILVLPVILALGVGALLWGPWGGAGGTGDPANGSDGDDNGGSGSTPALSAPALPDPGYVLMERSG